MGFSFEKELQKAENTINNIIEYCKLNGGSVYIGSACGAEFVDRLTEPICISYFVPAQLEQ